MDDHQDINTDDHPDDAQALFDLPPDDTPPEDPDFYLPDDPTPPPVCEPTHQQSTPPPPPPIISNPPIPAPDRPKRGRPRKIVNPPPEKITFDGSKPLENELFENMVKLRIAGHTQGDCFKIAHKKRVKDKSAKERASRIFSIPGVKARYVWLMMGVEKPQKAVKTDTKQAPKSTAVENPPTKSPPEARGTLDRDEIAARITDAVRNAESSLEISTAIKTALQAIPELATPTADAEPDPAQIAAHVARFAGAPLADMAGDDPSFVVDRLAKAAGMTLDQLADAIQGKRHTLPAPTPHLPDLPD